MATELISLEQSLRQLRLIVGAVPNPLEDHPLAPEVTLKARHASEIVLDYIKDRDNSSDWTPDACPGAIQAATLMVLSDLWEHRAGSDTEGVFLSNATKSLLHRYRDPTLA